MCNVQMHALILIKSKKWIFLAFWFLKKTIIIQSCFTLPLTAVQGPHPFAGESSVMTRGRTFVLAGPFRESGVLSHYTAFFTNKNPVSTGHTYRDMHRHDNRAKTWETNKCLGIIHSVDTFDKSLFLRMVGNSHSPWTRKTAASH